MPRELIAMLAAMRNNLIGTSNQTATLQDLFPSYRTHITYYSTLPMNMLSAHLELVADWVSTSALHASLIIDGNRESMCVYSNFDCTNTLSCVRSDVSFFFLSANGILSKFHRELI
jgi:hypothetical protein